MISSTAQAEGHLIGVLFEVRDQYLATHELVLGSPGSRFLRFLGVRRQPTVGSATASLDSQLRSLDAELPKLASLPLSPSKLNGAREYFETLRTAMIALQTLLKERSADERLPLDASPATDKCRRAARDFGRLTDRLRTQWAVPEQAPAPSPSPTANVRHSTTDGAAPQSRAAEPQRETAERQPIEISIDLAGRLFEVATIGMRNVGRPLLEQSGVDDETFRRLELEGLCLRLFTGRTAFIRENDQHDQHKTAGLDFFDELVAAHFDASPEHARIYAERSNAYHLALLASDDFEEALGREYSRLCHWEGELAKALGAAQASAMVVTAQEAVSDYRSNPLRALLAQDERPV